MTQTTDLKQVVEARITELIDQLRQEHPIFQTLDRDEQIRKQTDGMLERWQPQEVLDIPRDELKSIINDIMAFEGMFGLLDDLTPEQMQRFDEAVKRGN